MENAIFGHHKDNEWHDGISQKVDDLLSKYNESVRLIKPWILALIGLGVVNLMTNGSGFSQQILKFLPVPIPGK
jgi:hypothetical protein